MQMAKLIDLTKTMVRFISVVTRRAIRTIRHQLPDVNFITVHYVYFIGTCMLAATVFWGSSTPSNSVSFIDSLFMTSSAMTEAGLNTVNLSELNTFQQIILFLLIIIGSAIFVSISVVEARRKAFEKRIKVALRKHQSLKNHIRMSASKHTDNKSRSTEESSVEQSSKLHHLQDLSSANEFRSIDQADPTSHRGPSKQSALRDESSQPIQGRGPNFEAHSAFRSPLPPDHISFRTDFQLKEAILDEPTRTYRHRVLSFGGVGASRDIVPSPISLRAGRHKPTSSLHSHYTAITERHGQVDSRHSLGDVFDEQDPDFRGLSYAERMHFGGTEYKAVVFLSWVVPLYFVIWQIFGCLAMGAYMNRYFSTTARENGLNPWWLGAFNAVSAFNNSGMSLLDANMTAFDKDAYMLLSMCFFILAGNTCYPIFLRLFIWLLYKSIPDNNTWSERKHTLMFLLKHPRRCYTNLFPSHHTWWLFLSVLMLNFIDTLMFAILNIGNDSLKHMALKYEILDGLFQAIAVRSGGFYVVNISTLRIGLQVLYVIMMYISAYPIAITMRSSNVYEELSLGIYPDTPQYEEAKNSRSTANPLLWPWRGLQPPEHESSRRNFVKQQLRAQIAHDLWWLVLAVWLIMIIEGRNFETNPSAFSVFNVIFEVVSGYGTVGISVGYPDVNYSFCGSWHTLSKLVLCAVMLRGRHRGLPVAIDKAVLLPTEPFRDLSNEDILRMGEPSLKRENSEA